MQGLTTQYNAAFYTGSIGVMNIWVEADTCQLGSQCLYTLPSSCSHCAARRVKATKNDRKLFINVGGLFFFMYSLLMVVAREMTFPSEM